MSQDISNQRRCCFSLILCLSDRASPSSRGPVGVQKVYIGILLTYSVNPRSVVRKPHKQFVIHNSQILSKKGSQQFHGKPLPDCMSSRYILQYLFHFNPHLCSRGFDQRLKIKRKEGRWLEDKSWTMSSLVPLINVFVAFSPSSCLFA